MLMSITTVGDYFICEGDVWTVVHSTWQKIIIAKNALGLQQSFKFEGGRWRVVGRATSGFIQEP
jgi:hypothetical protein